MTAFNEAVLADCYVAEPEPLSIPASEFQVDGWVRKPKDYDPNQKYPAIPQYPADRRLPMARCFSMRCSSGPARDIS